MKCITAYLISLAACSPIVVSAMTQPARQHEEMQQKRIQTICMAASPELCR